MAQRLVSRLESFFKQKADGRLRSIIKYNEGDYSVVYLRDDVASQYTQVEAEKVIDESRFESLSAPVYNDMVSEEHGDLVCLVKCFENVVEMNFVLNDGIGAAVALDIEALAEAHDLVANARAVVEKERDQKGGS